VGPSPANIRDVNGLAVSFVDVAPAPQISSQPSPAGASMLTSSMLTGSFVELIALLLAPASPGGAEAPAAVPEPDTDGIATTSGGGTAGSKAHPRSIASDRLGRALIRSMLIPVSGLSVAIPGAQEDRDPTKDEGLAPAQCVPAPLQPVSVVSVAAEQPLNLPADWQPARASADSAQPGRQAPSPIRRTAGSGTTVRPWSPSVSMLAFALQMTASAETARGVDLPASQIPAPAPSTNQDLFRAGKEVLRTCVSAPAPLQDGRFSSSSPGPGPDREPEPRLKPLPRPAPAADSAREAATTASHPRTDGPPNEPAHDLELPALSLLEPKVVHAFADSVHAPAPPFPKTDSAPLALEPPHHMTATVLRESEPPQPAAGQPANFVQEIGIRVGRSDAPPVDVQLIERGGQVRVEVRTPDPALQTSLREDLGTLVNSLERTGFRTEAFIPPDAPRSTAFLPPPQIPGAESGTFSYSRREGRGEPQDHQRPRPRRQRPEQIESLETAA
jgi:hypothetical protein